MSRQSRIKQVQKRKAMKKRRPKNVPVQRLGSGKLLRRMSRNYLDVLENIEAVLVACWRHDPSIDDAVAHQALRAAMRDKPPAEDSARAIVEGLAEMRLLREDVSDQVWRDSLLTVAQSVQRHSLCLPGEMTYLRFVSPFIA